MRKITDQAQKAFWSNGYFKQDNTKVDIKPIPHGRYEITMSLHNNPIATRSNGFLTISSCGWGTNTTKERLNGVLKRLGWQIRQHKGEWYVCNSQTEETILFYDGMQFRI